MIIAAVMTLLERKKRRKSNAKYHLAKGPAPHKRKSVADLGAIAPVKVNQNEKMQVDTLTEQAIKVEVLDLLRGRGGTCSIFEMVSALAESNKVRKTYAEKSSNGIADRLKRFTKSVVKGFVFAKERKNLENEKMKRRYELTIAFAKMQQEQGATTTTVGSWDEARDFLKSVIEFPDEEDSEALVEAKIEGARKTFEGLGVIQSPSLDLEPSDMKWRQIVSTSLPPKLGERRDEDKDVLTKEVEAQYAEREKAKKSQVVEDLQRRMEEKEKEEEAKKLASSLLRDFTEEETDLIQEAIWGGGPSNEILQSEGTDSVQRESMRKLQPGQWLNDEIIHFFYVMLGKRDEELCKADPNRKRSHFFKSFFITTLLNEGHSDPAIDG